MWVITGGTWQGYIYHIDPSSPPSGTPAPFIVHEDLLSGVRVEIESSVDGGIFVSGLLPTHPVPYRPYRIEGAALVPVFDEIPPSVPAGAHGDIPWHFGAYGHLAVDPHTGELVMVDELYFSFVRALPGATELTFIADVPPEFSSATWLGRSGMAIAPSREIACVTRVDPPSYGFDVPRHKIFLLDPASRDVNDALSSFPTYVRSLAFVYPECLNGLDDDSDGLSERIVKTKRLLRNRSRSRVNWGG